MSAMSPMKDSCCKSVARYRHGFRVTRERERTRTSTKLMIMCRTFKTSIVLHKRCPSSGQTALEPGSRRPHAPEVDRA